VSFASLLLYSFLMRSLLFLLRFKGDRVLDTEKVGVADLGYESSFMEFLKLGLKLTFGYVQN